jgi:methanethiol S-methyltransferase
MGRLLGFLYGVANYLIFLGVFLYLIVFLGDITEFMGITFPKTVDYGAPAAGTVFSAVLIDLALLALFGVQHTVMARPGFKKALTAGVPKLLERSTYLLASNALLLLLYWQWRPLPETVWASEGVLAIVLTGLFWLGIVLVLVTTFLIDHFDLFGLRQSFAYLTGKPVPTYQFVTPSVYKMVRHPLYVGWLLMFWAAPVMSQGRLLLAGVWTVYILIAIRYEERDLIAHFGKKYQDYVKSVPMLVPFWKPKK